MISRCRHNPCVLVDGHSGPCQFTEISVGDKYKHYKGGTYTIIAIAKHHDTQETWIVYQGDSGIWIRPAEEFITPRFRKL